MRITQEADYALRIMLFLSKSGEGARIDARTISENQSVSLRFTLKILRKLTQAGLTQSFRGINGGYSLNKPLEDINLKIVIEAIDGVVHLNRCLNDPEACNKKSTASCEIHHELSRIQKMLLKELEEANFKKMLNK